MWAFGDNGAELVVGYHYIFGTEAMAAVFNEDGFVYGGITTSPLEFEELGFGGILGELFRAGSIRRNRKRILIDGMAVAMLVMVATPASKLTVHTRLSALSSVVSNVLYPLLAQAFFPCAVSMV